MQPIFSRYMISCVLPVAGHSLSGPRFGGQLHHLLLSGYYFGGSHQIRSLIRKVHQLARNEPPDIDVDFEHERREEVIQYIYQKYGRERAAIVATVTQEQQQGAIRDVGKAMGLSVDTIKQISSSIWEFTPEFLEGKRISEQGLNPADPT